MAFNHYAKIKRILDSEQPDWIIRRINEPTTAKNFRGETIEYSHYYRIYRSSGEQIPFCKFQKIDLLAKTLGTEVTDLPVIEEI